MGERSALYAAVCADPRADLPRLVFADWLDDHGEPERAAFIRCEIEFAQQRAFGQRPEGVVWRGRAKGINRYGRPPADAPELAGVAFTHHQDRGFASGVALSRATGLPEFAEAVRWAVPMTWVRLIGGSKSRSAGFVEFCRVPLLAQVRELVLTRVPFGDAGVAALARSPHLHELKSLDLRHTGLTDAGIRILIAAPWFPTLQRLDIDANPFTATGVEALLACGTKCDLTHFRLTNWRELMGEIVAPARAMWDANTARLAAAGQLYFGY